MMKRSNLKKVLSEDYVETTSGMPESTNSFFVHKDGETRIVKKQLIENSQPAREIQPKKLAFGNEVVHEVESYKQFYSDDNCCTLCLKYFFTL